MNGLSTPPQPLIRGALRQTPLAEFLVQAYDGGLEGTLLLQTPQREKSAVLFVRGAPAKARPATNTIYLGAVAADLGLIQRSVAVSTQKRAEAEKRPHGVILQEEGYLDETGLYVALREQLTRQVLAFCGLPDTTGFGFYQANYLADWGPVGQWRVKPLPMIWRALADHLPTERRDAWLNRLGDTLLKVRSEAPVSRYHLAAPEKTIVDMLRAKPTTVAQLCDSGVGAPELVRRVACALLLTRQIQIGSKKDPVGLHEPAESPKSIPPPETRAAQRAASLSPPSAHGAGPDSSAPRSPRPRTTPPGSSTSPRPTTTAPTNRTAVGPGAPSPHEELRAEILAYRERNPQNHYDVLGVDPSADVPAIRAAFFQLARRWHPDRLPKELLELKPFVTKAFAAMGEAHQALSDKERRVEYDRSIKDVPDEEQAQVAAILDAASAFQRAEVYMKKKDYARALKEAQAAYDGDQTQADYVALYVWLKSVNGTAAEQLLPLLDTAIKGAPDNVRALWYRGQLLKKLGKTMLAVKDFRHIVELKPNHVEAQRELRVYTMRKQSGGNKPTKGNKQSGGSTQTSGFFGVFKKKE